MKIIVSPTKTQKIRRNIKIYSTKPIFNVESEHLAAFLADKTEKEIIEIFNASDKISSETCLEYQNFKLSNNYGNAIETFTGTVFKELKINEYNRNNLDFLQSHVRIMSGLYGILKPFDSIKKYRLDFENKIFTKDSIYKNLYIFWSEKINKYFSQDDKILNLASVEYSKILKSFYEKKMINIYFLSKKNQKLKSISMNIKKQKGKILDYIIKNNIEDFIQLKKYQSDGYIYNLKKSDNRNYYFIRNEE